MFKQNVVSLYIYEREREIFSSLKKEGNSNTCYNMDGT